MNKRISAAIALCLVLSALFSSCTGSVSEETSAHAATSVPPVPTESTPEPETELLPPDGAAILTDFADRVSDGDWAPALDAALRENDTVFLPAGEYPMSRVVIPSGKTVCGAGSATVIRQLSTDQLFNIQGSRPKQSNLAADMADFSDTFTTKADLGLKPGDVVYLLGQRNCMILEDCGFEWCLGRSYASGTATFYSEFLTVKAVSGKTVTTEEHTRFPAYLADGAGEHDPPKPEKAVSDWPYRRSSSTVYLVDFVENVTLRDFTVTDAAGYTVYAVFARDLTVENVHGVGPSDAASAPSDSFVRLLDCLDCEVCSCSFTVPVRPDVRLIAGAGDFGVYVPFRIVGCSRCGFTNCSSDFSSFAFQIGKKHANGVSADCYIRSCTARDCIWGGVFVSQGTIGSEISDCDYTAPIGVMCAGRGAVIRDNRFTAAAGAIPYYNFVRDIEGGRCGVMLTEGFSVDSTVSGNVMHGFDTAICVRDGYEKTNLFERGRITVTGNTADGCLCAFRVWKNSFNKGTAAFDLTVTGNEFIARAGASAALSFAGVSFGMKITGNVFRGFGGWIEGEFLPQKGNVCEPNVTEAAS